MVRAWTGWAGKTVLVFRCQNDHVSLLDNENSAEEANVEPTLRREIA